MGVRGLWRLLLPIGRKISIETLEGKILAIDASIWLTQFIKAMRDPDTGSVRPAAHLIGFFRRLCKLRYHGIRPVFVFDGATPEIKLREIQQRRKRREQLSVSSSGGDAIQRMAKRLLVQQLKNEKGGSGKLSIARKSSSAANTARSIEANKGENSDAAGMVAVSASCAPGFYDPESVTYVQRQETTVKDGTTIAADTEESNPDPTNAVIDPLDDDAYEDPPALERSDWDTAVVPLLERSDEGVDEDHDNFFDADYVASLPSAQRKDRVEDAQRRQRMQSRKEFMKVAADPEGLSKCQLRNFLRSTKLNKNIVKMAKKAAEKDALTQTSHRVVFEKDGEAAVRDDDEEEEKEEGRQKNRLVRVRRKARGQKEGEMCFKKRRLSSASSSSDESDEVEWKEGGECHGQFASAPRPRAILETESDDESDMAGGFFPAESGSGGAFLPAASPTNSLTTESLSNRVIINVDDPESDDGGGGFITESLAVEKDARIAQELYDEDLARALQYSEETEDDEASRGGLNTNTEKEVVCTDSKAGSIPKHVGTPSIEHCPSKVKSIQERQDVGLEKDGGKMGRTPRNERENISDEVEPVDCLPTVDIARKPAATINNCVEGFREKDDEMQPHTLQDSRNGPVVVDKMEARSSSLTDKLTELDTKSSKVHQLRKGVGAGKVSIECYRDCAPDQHTSDDSDGDVDWEDGVEQDNGTEDSRKQQTYSKYDGGFVAVTIDPRDSDLRVMEAGINDDPWSGDSRPQSADETAAALEHAQQTAAKLTNWAGRAFRRAIAMHAENLGTSNAPSTESSTTLASSRYREASTIHKKGEDEKKETDDSVGYEKLFYSTRIGEPSAAENEEITRKDKCAQTEVLGSNHGSTRLASAWPEIAGETELTKETLEQYSKKWTEERNQMERDMDTVTDEMRADAVQLLRLFGVPFVEAPAEAEAQCVILEKLGLVDGIVTEDSDAFVFGAKVVYKNIFDDNKFVEVYNSCDAKKEMNISHDGMIALAMLMGSDYTDGVKGVGIVNGMEILDAFDVSNDLNVGLNNFRKWLDGFDPADSVPLPEVPRKLSKEEIFHRSHHTARTRWSTPKYFPDERVVSAYKNPIVDKSNEKFSWGVPDLDGLILFCNRHIGWESSETERHLTPVIKKLQTGSIQTRIDSFMKYEDGIKFASIRSKRLKDVLEGSNQNKDGDF